MIWCHQHDVWRISETGISDWRSNVRHIYILYLALKWYVGYYFRSFVSEVFGHTVWLRWPCDDGGCDSASFLWQSHQNLFICSWNWKSCSWNQISITIGLEYFVDIRSGELSRMAESRFPFFQLNRSAAEPMFVETFELFVWWSIDLKKGFIASVFDAFDFSDGTDFDAINLLNRPRGPSSAVTFWIFDLYVNHLNCSIFHFIMDNFQMIMDIFHFITDTGFRENRWQMFRDIIQNLQSIMDDFHIMTDTFSDDFCVYWSKLCHQDPCINPAADSRLRDIWAPSESWRLHLCHCFEFLSPRRPVDSHISNPGYALIDRSMLPENRDIRERRTAN
jgi:hypothetical protein